MYTKSSTSQWVELDSISVHGEGFMSARMFFAFVLLVYTIVTTFLLLSRSLSLSKSNINIHVSVNIYKCMSVCIWCVCVYV